jgi:hypothetical protein
VLNVSIYFIGWLVFLQLQMENSIKSTSNGLGSNWAGRAKWLKVQSSAIIARGFLCIVLYLPLVQLVTNRVGPVLERAGLSNYVWGYAGLAGFFASVLVYQVLGWVPNLRKEIPELAPTPEMEKRLAEQKQNDSNPTP